LRRTDHEGPDEHVSKPKACGQQMQAEADPIEQAGVPRGSSGPDRKPRRHARFQALSTSPRRERRAGGIPLRLLPPCPGRGITRDCRHSQPKHSSNHARSSAFDLRWADSVPPPTRDRAEASHPMRSRPRADDRFQAWPDSNV
jgi:hypothetical protein